MKYLFIKYVHKLNCTNYMKNFKVDLVARAHVFQPFGPGSIHSKSLFFFLSLLITKTTSFWVCFITLLTLIFSICLSLQQQPFFPFPLHSFSI